MTSGLFKIDSKAELLGAKTVMFVAFASVLRTVLGSVAAHVYEVLQHPLSGFCPSNVFKLESSIVLLRAAARLGVFVCAEARPAAIAAVTRVLNCILA